MMEAMKPKVQLLENEDIFDFYGCEWLLNCGQAMPHARVEHIEKRLRDVHERYVTSVRERIKAEAGFCGVELDDDFFSIKKLLTQVNEMITASVQNQAEDMLKNGTGVNLMGEILKGHQMAGQDMTGIDMGQFGLERKEPEKPKDTINPDWFTSNETDDRKSRLFDNPKWHEIAKAFVSLEEAVTIPEIIKTIDFLNDMQHNSFHILIDLQTGRMLDGCSEGENHGKDRQARSNLQEVLDIKYNSRSPSEFADKMSESIGSLVKRYEEEAKNGS